MSDNANVTLVLNWYEKAGTSLIGEEVIHDMSLDSILDMFEAPFWNRNFQCWAIDDSHVDTIQPHVEHRLDTSKYCYFIEAYKAR